MFLSREIDKKNCVNIIHKSVCTKFCIKIVGFKQIRNQSENDDIPEKPEKLRFALVIIYNFNFAFLIDIIDKIFTYSPYYVTRTSTNGSAVSLSRVSMCIT